MKTTIVATLGGLLLASAMGSVSANPATSTPAPAQAKQDILATLSSTKVSLDDAIKTAEQTIAGKLVKAELDNDSSPNTYRVAIADNNSRTVTFMKIDSNTGKVLASKVYHPDNRAANTSSKGSAAQVKATAAPASGAMKPVDSTARHSAALNRATSPAANAPASSPLQATTAPAANPLKTTAASTPASNPLKAPTVPATTKP